MRHIQYLRILVVVLFSTGLNAQQSFQITPPDVQITADRILRGDGDTYGLGDWHCSFSATLDGAVLQIDGKISFTEKANDFTTIVGVYSQRIVIGELQHCKQCIASLDESSGTVSGPNIGARGYRWFGGQGLVRRAYIRTDTFGSDAGNIGGTIQFMPIKVLLSCSIAGVD